ncbi:9302_t:CDS:2, partial [Gigaspora rosea]
YGDPFSLYIFGSVRTFAGADSSHEVFQNSPDIFDHHTAINVLFPVHEVYRQYLIHEDAPAFSAHSINESINGRIYLYTSRIQKDLLFGIEKYFGDCKGSKRIKNIHDVLSLIIAKPIVNVFLGEEAAQFDDIVESFSGLEKDVFKLKAIPPILLFIHPSLHKKAVTLPLKLGWKPINKHRDLFIRRFKLIVEERVRQRIVLGKKYILKDDLLDFVLSEPDFKTEVVDDKFLDKLFGIIYANAFAAVHSTTRFLAMTLFEYGGRPEFWKEIYEEQLMIHNEINNNLEADNVNKMIKLECFIKESFRNSSDFASLPHALLKDSYTFKNGATIPKGRIVNICTKDVTLSSNFYGETSKNFQPSRHITTYSGGTTIHAPLSKVDKGHIAFGGGRRACPGRFLATHILKIFMHNLVLRYNIRTKSGKVDPKKIIATFVFQPTSELIFENRNY